MNIQTLTEIGRQEKLTGCRFYLLGILISSLLAGCSSRTQTELQWKQRQGYRWAAIDPGSAENPGFNRVVPSQTGINFSNHVSEKEITQNEHYLNGSGVAAADVDGDGLTDLYFAQLNGPNRLYKNIGGFQFQEVTGSAGVAHSGYYSTGVVFADVDNDGDPDLLVASVHKGVTLYVNNGRGRFESSRESQFSTTRGKGNTTLALSDIDGDADLDLYVTNLRARSLDDVMELRERGWEKTIKEEYTPNRDKYTLVPPFDDYYTLVDQKNKPPLRLEIGEKDQLFINDGNGVFTEAADMKRRFLDRKGESAGMSPDWGLAAKFQDLNDDGLPDLYVCNDFWTPDRIWINQGRGVFKPAGPQMFANFSYSSMAVDFSDINRDGSVDVFATEMLSPHHEQRLRQEAPGEPFPDIRFDAGRDPQYRRNSLYLNRGDNTYAEISYYSGIEASGWSWTTKFMDVNLDGYEDLLINTGYSYNTQDLDTQRKLGRIHRQLGRQTILQFPRLELPQKAFRNNGDLTFSDVSSDWGFKEADISQGMAVADLDRDGDLDVVSNRFNQTATVFENRTSAPRITIRLTGHPQNTTRIGTKLTLTGGPVRQSQQITAGGDYLSGSPPIVVFAADPSNPNHRLRISWPNGEQTVIDSIRANRLYEIQNPETFHAAAQTPSSAQTVFKDISARINHSHQESNFGGDFKLQPLLPYHLSRLGPGLSWIDYDRDRDDDLFIAAGRGRRTGIYQNNGVGTFESISLDKVSRPAAGDQTIILGWATTGGTRLLTGSANYEEGSMQAPSVYTYSVAEQQVKADSLKGVYSTTGPMAAADYDGDKDLDLFVGGRFLPFLYPRSANSRLFTNHDRLFQLDFKNSNALKQVGLVTGAVFSDYDLDGDPDLIVSTEWGPVKLFQNHQGNFKDVTKLVGLDQYMGWWNGVTTGDFNNDGRPDIVATNIGQNSPYQPSTGYPLKMFYKDFNRDSRMDVIEAYYNPKSEAYMPRRGLLDFKSIGRTMAQNVNSHSEFAEATLSQILGTNPRRIPSRELNTVRHMVFINNEDGSFTPHPLPSEAQFSAAFSANVADLDNDGNEDLFLSQNLFSVRPLLPRLDAGRGLWLKGDGKGNFSPLAGYESGIKIYGEQRGAALADINADGRVDMAVAQNNAPVRLFLNRTEERGLRIRLVGPPENRDAIGADIRVVYEDGRKGPLREIQAGSGYWSQNSPVQVLGYSRDAKPVAIAVEWPGGSTEKVSVQPEKWNYVITYNGQNIEQKL